MTDNNIQELELISMDEIEEETVNYLYYPYIPISKLTVLCGESGIGKTQFLMKIIAALTTGEVLPGAEKTTPINVIYLTGEDGLGDTIKQRLRVSKADCSRVFVIKDDDFTLTLSDKRIEAAVAKTKAKLLVIDPVQAFADDKTDFNSLNHVRRFLKPIYTLAMEYKCAVLLVCHPKKGKIDNPLDSISGSKDFINAARSALIIGRAPDDSDVRVVTHEKSSLTREGLSRAFKITENNGIEWVEGYEELVGRDVIGNYRNSTARVNKHTNLDKAKAFLESRFRVPTREYVSNLREELSIEFGIAWEYAKRAKSTIEYIEVYKNHDKWVWTSVPEDLEKIRKTKTKEESGDINPSPVGD